MGRQERKKKATQKTQGKIKIDGVMAKKMGEKGLAKKKAPQKTQGKIKIDVSHYGIRTKNLRKTSTLHSEN